MKRKDYQKPTMKVVELQHRHQILAGSLTETTTNLGEDDIDIGEETPENFWGR